MRGLWHCLPNRTDISMNKFVHCILLAGPLGHPMTQFWQVKLIIRRRSTTSRRVRHKLVAKTTKEINDKWPDDPIHVAKVIFELKP